MNKLRKIYYPLLAVLLVLLVVFSTLSATVNFSTPFISTEAIRTNAEKIASAGNYDATDDILSTSSTGDRYKIVSAINTLIKNTLTTKYKTVYNTNGATQTYTSGASSSTSDILMGQYVVLNDDEKEEKKYELAPAYYSSRVTVDQADMDAIPNAMGKGLYKGMIFQNIVLYIPGSQSKTAFAKSAQPNDFSFTYDESKLTDVVMMVAHYDSNVGDNGYTNNSVTIATMIGLLDKIVNGGRSYKNDIIMLFTDASSHNGLGLEMFMKSPEYADLFGNARSRIKSVAVFDNVGSVSTVVASSAKGSDTVSVFATAGDWYHSGSFSGNVASANVGGKEFSTLSGVSAIEILGVGNKSEITTSKTLSDSVINRVASVIGSYADRFGSADIGVLDNNAVIGFYSYVGLNFWFASYVAYIIGALVVALAGLIVWFIIKKNAIDPKKTGKGVAVSLISVVATVATVTVLYLLLTLVLSLFGVINVASIGTLVTANIWYFILALVVSVVFLVLYNVIFRKAFNVKALDVVRGNAWLVILVAAVMCFAFPTYSYLFAGLAIMQGATMVLTVLLKEKFKAKFGFDIERLMLYGAFAILLMPVVFAEVVVVYMVSPAILLPLTLSLVLVYVQSIIPYVLIMKDLYGVPAKKEENANTENGNVTKKPAVSKKSVFAVSVITVLVYAAALIVGLLSVNHNGLSATQSTFSGNDAIYNNTFVYEYNDINGKKSRSIILKDLDLYEYMKNDLGAFVWDVNRNAYTLSDNTDVADLPVASDGYVPFYKHSETKLFKFNTDNLNNDIRLGEKPAMTVTFATKNADDTISKIRLINNAASLTTTEGQSASMYEEIVVNGKTVTVTLPAGYGKDLGIEVFVKGKSDYTPLVELSVKVNAIYVTGNLDKLGDLTALTVQNDVIADLNSKYSSNEIINNIYFAFEYNYEGSVSVRTSK